MPKWEYDVEFFALENIENFYRNYYERMKNRGNNSYEAFSSTRLKYPEDKFDTLIILLKRPIEE